MHTLALPIRYWFGLMSLICCLSSVQAAPRWGFYAHKKINRLATYSLPPEMFVFYKAHIRFITEEAVSPDARRYAVKGEAPRHYIDLDVYGDSALQTMPRRWEDAVARYTEDTLMAYGIVPWHLVRMKLRLTDAFGRKDPALILRLSAEIGHYIGDANVPLHTTQNYNGQLTGQHGIHGFWESRLPELFSDEYELFLEPARYLPNPTKRIWEAVAQAHHALDSVLRFERELTEEWGTERKYAFEDKNGLTVKTYSREFAAAFHRRLAGQVERQMKSAAQMIADFWYTCWIDAGQPDLQALLSPAPPPQTPEEPAAESPLPVRPHDP